MSATDVIAELSAYEVSGVTARDADPQSTFNQQPFGELQPLHEDVQLNLDLREKLQGRVMLCPGMSGAH